VAVAIQASFVETQLGRVQVGTASPMLYGLTLFTPADRLPKDGPTPNTLVARDVDVLIMFMDRVTSADIRQAGMLGRLQ